MAVAHSRSPVIGQNRLIGVEESLFRLYRGIELDQAVFPGFPQTAKICLPVDLCRHFFCTKTAIFCPGTVHSQAAITSFLTVNSNSRVVRTLPAEQHY